MAPTDDFALFLPLLARVRFWVDQVHPVTGMDGTAMRRECRATAPEILQLVETCRNTAEQAKVAALGEDSDALVWSLIEAVHLEVRDHIEQRCSEPGGGVRAISGLAAAIEHHLDPGQRLTLLEVIDRIPRVTRPADQADPWATQGFDRRPPG